MFLLTFYLLGCEVWGPPPPHSPKYWHILVSQPPSYIGRFFVWSTKNHWTVTNYAWWFRLTQGNFKAIFQCNTSLGSFKFLMSSFLIIGLLSHINYQNRCNLNRDGSINAYLAASLITDVKVLRGQWAKQIWLS